MRPGSEAALRVKSGNGSESNGQHQHQHCGRCNWLWFFCFVHVLPTTNYKVEWVMQVCIRLSLSLSLAAHAQDHGIFVKFLQIIFAARSLYRSHLIHMYKYFETMSSFGWVCVCLCASPWVWLYGIAVSTSHFLSNSIIWNRLQMQRNTLYLFL